MGDGKPIYSRDCKQVGSHEVTYQLEPHVFDDASTAEHIKAGQIIKCVYAGDKIGEIHQGFLVEIDEPGKGKKSPTAIEFLGASLK